MSELKHPQPPAQPVDKTDAPLILNVDDTEPLRYAKTRILRRGGYRVEEAASGALAMEMAEKLRPSLVLLDVKLPDMSGIEVCRRLKTKYPALLVLQTSATFVTGADRIAGLDSGADAYLTQPVEPDELLAAVKALLRMRAAEEGLRQANDLLEQRVAQRTEELRIRTVQLEESYRRLRHEIDEREKVEAVLRQSQKMEALGQLTGGIAHDFNNLLGAISGSLQLIEKRIKKGKFDIGRYLDAALTGTARAAKLTSRLLAFSRQQTLNLNAVDVNELIDGLADMLRRSMGEQIIIEIDLNADPAWIKCDENQLENALLNLAINARDAMPEGGTFKIETRHERLEKPDRQQNLMAGDYVVLTVSDTGTGMPKAVLERAMEPFFTTKPIGRGTGLGLSMIYGLMSQCGGGIAIESEEGKGTAVRLFLASAQVQVKSGTEDMTEEQQGEKTSAVILIAEDEDLIRMTMVDVLQEEGFQILEAHDGETALQQLAAMTGISLLITDVGLPGLNGRQLIERARTTHPDLKAIFVTGYSREILQQQTSEGGAQDSWIKDVPVLRKPFDLTDLVNKVRSVLDSD